MDSKGPTNIDHITMTDSESRDIAAGTDCEGFDLRTTDCEGMCTTVVQNMLGTLNHLKHTKKMLFSSAALTKLF